MPVKVTTLIYIYFVLKYDSLSYTVHYKFPALFTALLQCTFYKPVKSHVII